VPWLDSFIDCDDIFWSSKSTEAIPSPRNQAMAPRVSLRAPRNTSRSYRELSSDDSSDDSEYGAFSSLPPSPEPTSPRHQATRNRGKARISYKEDSDEEPIAEEPRTLKRKRPTRAAAGKSAPSKTSKPRKKRQLRDVGAPLRRNKSCLSQLGRASEPILTSSSCNPA
jgi:hypothetical protein